MSILGVPTNLVDVAIALKDLEKKPVEESAEALHNLLGQIECTDIRFEDTKKRSDIKVMSNGNIMLKIEGNNIPGWEPVYHTSPVL